MISMQTCATCVTGRLPGTADQRHDRDPAADPGLVLAEEGVPLDDARDRLRVLLALERRGGRRVGRAVHLDGDGRVDQQVAVPLGVAGRAGVGGDHERPARHPAPAGAELLDQLAVVLADVARQRHRYSPESLLTISPAVSTASKSPPCRLASARRASLFQCSSGVPLTYQAEPLSATITP